MNNDIQMDFHFKKTCQATCCMSTQAVIPQASARAMIYLYNKISLIRGL